MTEARPDTVALPERGDGSRSARRGRPSPPRPQPSPREPRRRRAPLRWLLALAGALALVVGAVVVLGLGGEDDEAPAAADGPAAEAARAARSTAVVLVRTLDGASAAVTLLVTDAAGAGGDLVHVPPGTMVEVPALGLVPLREAAAFSPEVAVSALENLLGVPIDASAPLGPVELEAAVQPGGPLEVELPSDVERRDGDRVATAFEAGRQVVAPGEVLDLLALPAETDLDRLVRHQSFWDAWLGVLAADPDARPSRSAMGPVADRLPRLADGDVVHHVLPVAAVDAGGGLYRVEEAGLARLLRRILPQAPSPDSRVDVQVLNGTGAPGAGQALVRPLVDAGARVALSGNADRFDHEVTQIVYYDEGTGLEAAERVRGAIGVGEVVRSRARIGVVDVTVVVGRDFPAGAAGSTSGTSEGATP